VAEEPLTDKNIPNYKIIFPAALLMGVFLAFWLVMIRYYLRHIPNTKH
jgi:hypothetical protein